VNFVPATHPRHEPARLPKNGFSGINPAVIDFHFAAPSASLVSPQRGIAVTSVTDKGIRHRR